MLSHIWIKGAALAVGMAFVPVLAQAKLIRQSVDYPAGDIHAHGYLVYDDAAAGKQPGVLVVHEWWGLNDNIKRKTEQVAELGYVAFAADMYGDGMTTTDAKTAGRWAGEVKGSPQLRERAQAALAVLAKQPQVDPRRLAAIGFCFGGTTALELAYSGAELAGVTVFHGGLTVPGADDVARIKPKVLILHGTLDPFTPPATVHAMREALDKAGVDYQMVYYSGAAHAFTNPGAGNHPETGMAYNERATQRAWTQMRTFFREIFPAETNAAGEAGK